MRRIGLFVGPFLCISGISILTFSIINPFTAGFEIMFLLPLIFIPEFMGGHAIPIEILILLYFAQTSTPSQYTILLALGGITLIIVGIVSLILGYKAATETGQFSWTPQPIVRETIKEREIVYIRCRYCGAKALETEKKCPNCGAKL